MKDLKGKFMNNPLSKVQLSEGILMMDTEGEVIGESNPIARDPSRQLTIHEYAAMKNADGGLKSQVSDVMLNKTKSGSALFGRDESQDYETFSRLKPDSAIQLGDEIYIGTRDDTGGAKNKYGQRKRSH